MEKIRSEMYVKVNEQDRILTIFCPTNISDRNYEKVHRDIVRIQYFSIGHGGTIDGDEYTMRFEQEEFNCVLRYLLKFSWEIYGSVTQLVE